MLLQRFREQRSELFESALRLLMVVNWPARNRPSVKSAFVHFALIFASPGVERQLEVLDGFRRHALVIGRMSEVQPRLDAREHMMGTGCRRGEESAAVKRCGRR